MTVKIVRVSASAYVDIGNIARFIVSVSRLSHAERYVDEINEELKSLGFLARLFRKQHTVIRNDFIQRRK